jgi:tetratricopeptide (TPR) repeat protein
VTDVAHARLFDRALQLRDAGDIDAATRLLQELITARAAIDKQLHALVLLQLGHLLGLLGQRTEAIASLRAATDCAPRMERASLELFRALDSAGERIDALCEAFRFLALRESLGYRELFESDAFRDKAGEEYELVEGARGMLDAHRDAQRRRARPMPGDTVRVLVTAPLRPRALARILGIKGQSAHLIFSDDERSETNLALIDHHDI